MSKVGVAPLVLREKNSNCTQAVFRLGAMVSISFKGNFTLFFKCGDEQNI